jgi:hypothetical protein
MSEDKVVPLRGPLEVCPAVGDPNVIQVNMPADIPQMKIGDLGFADMEAAFNMRGWLQKACEAAGGRMTGGGFGGGIADITIELEGHEYWIAIKSM